MMRTSIALAVLTPSVTVSACDLTLASQRTAQDWYDIFRNGLKPDETWQQPVPKSAAGKPGPKRAGGGAFSRDMLETAGQGKLHSALVRAMWASMSKQQRKECGSNDSFRLDAYGAGGATPAWVANVQKGIKTLAEADWQTALAKYLDHAAGKGGLASLYGPEGMQMSTAQIAGVRFHEDPKGFFVDPITSAGLSNTFTENRSLKPYMQESPSKDFVLEPATEGKERDWKGLSLPHPKEDISKKVLGSRDLPMWYPPMRNAGKSNAHLEEILASDVEVVGLVEFELKGITADQATNEKALVDMEGDWGGAPQPIFPFNKDILTPATKDSAFGKYLRYRLHTEPVAKAQAEGNPAIFVYGIGIDNNIKKNIYGFPAAHPFVKNAWYVRNSQSVLEASIANQEGVPFSLARYVGEDGMGSAKDARGNEAASLGFHAASAEQIDMVLKCGFASKPLSSRPAECAKFASQKLAWKYDGTVDWVSNRAPILIGGNVLSDTRDGSSHDSRMRFTNAFPTQVNQMQTLGGTGTFVTSDATKAVQYAMPYAKVNDKAGNAWMRKVAQAYADAGGYEEDPGDTSARFFEHSSEVIVHMDEKLPKLSDGAIVEAEGSASPVLYMMIVRAKMPGFVTLSAGMDELHQFRIPSKDWLKGLQQLGQKESPGKSEGSFLEKLKKRSQFLEK